MLASFSRSDAMVMSKAPERPMPGKKAKQKLQAWSEARARHHLTEAQVQMARELGLDPARLGNIDNHDQERWKRPLPEFIEDSYRKRFGKTPHEVGHSPPEHGRREEHGKEEHEHAKKKAPSTKPERHAQGRESRESPRGSTIPPFPKQRIDD
jgi:hypothetical protein